MNKIQRNSSAFTLIELLMVIAIIGILAGILIPTVGSVKKQANIAASKSQLSNYVNAIGMFKSEYKYITTDQVISYFQNSKFFKNLDLSDFMKFSIFIYKIKIYI